MFAVDRLILVAGLLLLIGIGSSKFSARAGVPVLVLFLAVGRHRLFVIGYCKFSARGGVPSLVLVLTVGMLAGSEGIGGIALDNYVLAHGSGTIALAVSLFDGGLRTSLDAVRATWKPAF